MELAALVRLDRRNLNAERHEPGSSTKASRWSRARSSSRPMLAPMSVKEVVLLTIGVITAGIAFAAVVVVVVVQVAFTDRRSPPEPAAICADGREPLRTVEAPKSLTVTYYCHDGEVVSHEIVTLP